MLKAIWLKTPFARGLSVAAFQKKMPFMKWYYADIRAEKTLKFCSWEARYLWREMLEYMHESEKPGYLLFSEADLVELVHGATPERIRNCLFELETNKVFSRDRKGIIYSRKMVRDAKRAATAQKNGKAGGNPDLKNKGKKQKKNEEKPDLENPVNNGNERENQNWDNQTVDIPEARGQKLEAREDTNVSSTTGNAPPNKRLAKEAVDAGKEIAKIVGWDKDPRFFGDFSRCQAWIDAGWSKDLDIIPTVQSIMAKRGKDDPPRSIKYFERAIADAFATRTSPTPKGIPKNGKQSRTKDLANQASSLMEKYGDTGFD